MTKTFTHDDVIRYAYAETTEEENAGMEEALMADSDLLDVYLDLVDLKIGLDRAELTPPDRVVNRILAFSQNYQIQPQRLVF
ncbi:MAG: hypothetical protein H7Y12_02725 [Sphingobacteriaceae bacterium]|nr:hypothetical protein [Cytophagaceae bacterium]